MIWIVEAVPVGEAYWCMERVVHVLVHVGFLLAGRCLFDACSDDAFHHGQLVGR
jgi:hypothetical protein